jgi:hypothetical protein
MLSRRKLNLITLLEKAFLSFKLLFRIVKNSTEKVPVFCLFSFSQLFLETSSKFVAVEISYALGIFEKILRKNHIFKKSDIDYNALNSSSFRTWTTSNTLKIILNDFENSILFLDNSLINLKTKFKLN